MIKPIIIGATILSLFAVVSVGCRGHRCHGHGHKTLTLEKMEKIGKKIGNKLDFTDAQHAEMQKLVQKVHKELPAFREKRHAVRDTMITQFENDSFDAAAVNRSIKGLTDDVPAIQKLAVSTAADFHAILTPEQRKEVVEHMKKHRERHSK